MNVTINKITAANIYLNKEEDIETFVEILRSTYNTAKDINTVRFCKELLECFEETGY